MTSVTHNPPTSVEPVKTEVQAPELVQTQELVDYSKVYEELLAQFNQAYLMSQKMFITEKTQRQTLYYYKRRNNALLDFLAKLDEDERIAATTDLDLQRINSVIAKKPELLETLTPLLQMASSLNHDDIQLKESYNVGLAVDEIIPELVGDELDIAEVNPQDTEMWTRRNYSHLVVSKFKPVEIRSKGVREYTEPPSLNNKRRKK